MSKEKQIRICEFCGRHSAHNIESHHIYGRAISDETIDICANCHAVITPTTNKVTKKLKEYEAEVGKAEKKLFWEKIRFGLIGGIVGFLSGAIYICI